MRDAATKHPLTIPPPSKLAASWLFPVKESRLENQANGLVGFLFLLAFFIFGYILIANERFMRAIRRDWLLYLILGILCVPFFFSVAAGAPVSGWLGAPGTLGFYVSHSLWSINSWCWTMVMLHVGMRFLEFTNRWLKYGRETSFAFFFFHQPAIIFIRPLGPYAPSDNHPPGQDPRHRELVTWLIRNSPALIRFPPHRQSPHGVSPRS